MLKGISVNLNKNYNQKLSLKRKYHLNFIFLEKDFYMAGHCSGLYESSENNNAPSVKVKTKTLSTLIVILLDSKCLTYWVHHLEH